MSYLQIDKMIDLIKFFKSSRMSRVEITEKVKDIISRGTLSAGTYLIIVRDHETLRTMPTTCFRSLSADEMKNVELRNCSCNVLKTADHSFIFSVIPNENYIGIKFKDVFIDVSAMRSFDFSDDHLLNFLQTLLPSMVR